MFPTTAAELSAAAPFPVMGCCGPVLMHPQLGHRDLGKYQLLPEVIPGVCWSCACTACIDENCDVYYGRIQVKHRW